MKVKKKRKNKPLTKAQLKRKARITRRNNLKAWSVTVRTRDKTCIICGSDKYLNAHHLLPKEYFHQYELDPMNGVAVCSFHHKWSPFSCHKNPIWFSEWLRTNRPEQYDLAVKRLKDLSLSGGNKTTTGESL